ncbi:hypothetical protein RhiirA4_470925 [Rhizophagus irregularis]|uniref:Uncharacterized protein n=1 Tax=Rhizophagus irregularis TaxID=588596 RepID=A0A2I1H256_9GLOM|nr:hypothetical protein RhiirA4_470925 [Rhizophagus irregularis]
MSMNKNRIQYEPAVEFVSEFNLIFYQNITYHLSSFIEDSFLKNLFEKNTLKSVNKVQLLIEKFGINITYDKSVIDDGLDKSSEVELDDNDLN